jgi:hypothetical protein
MARVQVLAIGEQDGFIRWRFAHDLAQLARIQKFSIPRLDEHCRRFNKNGSFHVFNAACHKRFPTFHSLDLSLDHHELLSSTNEAFSSE